MKCFKYKRNFSIGTQMQKVIKCVLDVFNKKNKIENQSPHSGLGDSQPEEQHFRMKIFLCSRVYCLLEDLGLRSVTQGLLIGTRIRGLIRAPAVCSVSSVRVRACTCVCVQLLGTSIQCLPLPLCISFFLKIGQPTISRICLSLPSNARRRLPSHAKPFSSILGIELRSSYFLEKHFTNCAISLIYSSVS